MYKTIDEKADIALPSIQLVKANDIKYIGKSRKIAESLFLKENPRKVIRVIDSKIKLT